MVTAIIVGIILFIIIQRLQNRIDALEKRLGVGPPPANQPAAPASAAPPATTAQAPPPAPAEPGAVEQLIEWIKEDWLLKLGALLLLIAFGWLATYAFLHNWIGPVGRIALGIIAGVIILVFGWWRMRKHINQGGVFLVLGSTTILLTIFAAREVYDFFTPLIALSAMLLTTAFVALASVRHNVRSLSLLSLILAGIAPLLTNTPSPNYVALFWYLLVVTVGAIWIVTLRKWNILTAAALILIMLYSLPHLLSLVSTDDTSTLLYLAYAFAAIFFTSNTVGILKLQKEKIAPDLVTAAGNGLFLLAWILTAAPEEWQSLSIAAWMVIFAIGGFAIFTITKRREPFYIYAGVGIAMLAAATAVELEGASLTLAYIIEAGVLAVIADLILRDRSVAQRVSLLLLGPIVLSYESVIAPAWRNTVFHKDFFVLLILALTLLVLGVYFWRRSKQPNQKDASPIHVILLIAGSVYIYLLLWLSLHAALRDDDRAIMLSLVIYTIIALVTYFYGQAKSNRALHIYGGVFLGLVILRLLLVDVWKMELTGRIITFFAVGTLLTSTAFIGRKKKPAISTGNSSAK